MSARQRVLDMDTHNGHVVRLEGLGAGTPVASRRLVWGGEGPRPRGRRAMLSPADAVELAEALLEWAARFEPG